MMTLHTDIGKFEIPSEVHQFLEWLTMHGYRVWLIGGIVRDWLMNTTPKDWDVATDALSCTILSSPFRTYPLGIRFGVVNVVTENHTIEIACIRETIGSTHIEEDLARRDFTMNAMAVAYPAGTFTDLFGGLRDLKNKRLRAVRNPEDRFSEDPLRILRGARFVSTDNFHITRSTFSAMKPVAPLIRHVAIERIRDELLRIILGDNVVEAFDVLRKTGALQVFLPELLEGWRKKQNEFHKYDIYHHILHTVARAPKRVRVRLAALLHDIAKPRVRTRRRGRFRFYGHEKLGEDMARDILTRWRVSGKLTEEVSILIRHHMIHGIEKWSDAAVRRLINRVGKDLIEDFLDLLKADRCAHGTRTNETIDEINFLEKRIKHQIASHRVLSLKDLVVNGHDVMRILNIGPGSQVGKILRAIHNHILIYPQDNRREILIQLIEDIGRRTGQCKYY